MALLGVGAWGGGLWRGWLGVGWSGAGDAGRLAGVVGRVGAGDENASSACIAVRACVDGIAGEEWPGGGSTRFPFGRLRMGRVDKLRAGASGVRG